MESKIDPHYSLCSPFFCDFADVAPKMASIGMNGEKSWEVIMTTHY